ncbi:hypothetical protein ALC60_06445 [Trachymyrmex zeteki]|uniref:Uncharacterized protein n=1 Tax=Mycetomoellerius zeteki TaxID=64791 RepID=A0A151X348_9HYME|nr:hypothetical protein ALC60_06445 [Trachymyrmex zeteki]
MFLLLTDKRGILDLTAGQLRYIPKIVLLCEFENFIESLWERLSKHLKADPEVQPRGMISAYGTGLLNKTINALPFEVHIPGYQFCGSGTRLAKRLARGDRGAMKAKTKLGMGMKRRRKTKRKKILPVEVTKRGGFLPILPMLDALGSLIGGAASVARAVSDRKAARRQVEGRGLYLTPYKRSGGGVKKRMKRSKKKNIEKGNVRDSENTVLRYHDERAI